MLEQFEDSRQHNVLHNVLRAEDRWTLSCLPHGNDFRKY